MLNDDGIQTNNDGTMMEEEAPKNLEMDAADDSMTDDDDGLGPEMIDDGMQAEDPEEEGDEIA